MSLDMSQMRKPYVGKSFDVGDLASRESPYAQFAAWMKSASEHDKIDEPNVACLATADKATAAPSARMILVKGVDPDVGFTFFTNYESRKGRELGGNPQAALNFYWEPLKRAVRIEGRVERLESAECDAYFESRPLGSRIGAHVSRRQSEVVASRSVLDEREAELKRRVDSEGPDAVKRPDYWGGFALKPHVFEFWQGHSTWIHDRLIFRRDSDSWVLERLSP